MHRAELTIDLPSEELPSDPVLLSVLKWIFTTEETGALERVTGDGLTWCRRLVGACTRGGLTDVVAMTADDTELYLDDRGKFEDFGEVVDAVVKRGGLQGGFSELRVVLSGTYEEWHAAATIRLRTEVEKGAPEIDLQWSARSLGMRVQPGESPAQYRDRITSLARDPSAAMAAFAAPEVMLDNLIEHFAHELGAPPAQSRRRVVVVPGPVQVGRFRTLGFERSLRDRTVRPVAIERRTGAYDEPQVYYFFDPYHDLLSWILAAEIVEGRWAGPDVELVDHHGNPLPVGAGAYAQWEVAPDAVVIGDEKIEVSAVVPDVAGLDVAEAGNPNTPGFGGGLS